MNYCLDQQVEVDDIDSMLEDGWLVEWYGADGGSGQDFFNLCDLYGRFSNILKKSIWSVGRYSQADSVTDIISKPIWVTHIIDNTNKLAYKRSKRVILPETDPNYDPDYETRILPIVEESFGLRLSVSNRVYTFLLKNKK